MHTPSLRFLKTFHIAAKRGSFKAAAEELCVTASAVSHQIKALEQQLGLALFTRRPRSLSLTEAGALYLENIDALFSRLESVTEQLQRRFSRTVVRLQVPPFFASELLVPRLNAFGAQHGDIDFQIETDIAPNEAHSPDADVSIVVGTGQWPDVQATRLFPQAYVAACSPERLRQAQIRGVADLAEQPLIAHNRRRDLWDRWAALVGIDALRPKQLIEFNSMASIVHAAEQGVGIALVSAPVAASRFAAGSLVKVFDTELITGDCYYLVTRPEDALRLGVRALIGWLLQQFGAGPLRRKSSTAARELDLLLPAN
jgi:LysR family transcriptional regulator, glycine cleavage system transcriptional activator